jgi:protein gp37
MADRSSIEWTEASWNPVRGCSIVSPGCTNCYAMKQAHRFSGAGKAYAGLTKMSKGGPVWTGAARTVPELLDAPLHWKKPRRIFVNSMSDLFHEDVPTDFIAQVFAVMAEAKRHTFQILTKRAERMQQLLAHDLNYEGPEWPLPNVWIGVSVEDQVRADERIPLLLQTPAAVRWISAEPLLGPVLLRRHIDVTRDGTVEGQIFVDHLTGLDWVVVGGESGPGARPFDIAWARSLRDQCRAAGVPVFIKQIGARPYDSSATHVPVDTLFIKNRKGGDPAEWPQDLRIREYPA